MAQFLLASIKILDPVHVAFAANDVLIVYWDDVTDDFALTLNGASFTTAGALLGSSGTNYTFTGGITSYTFTWATAGYSFCSGADLWWFRMLRIYPEYPFFQRVITSNSPVCDVGGGAVCDIHFEGAPIITHASNFSEGGIVSVTAVSSNGTVRYSMREDSDYDTMQVSGVFSGIIGTWTIYAKDENDCTAQIRVTVLYKPSLSAHYIATWKTLGQGQGTPRDERVIIYEREYVGSVVTLEYADQSVFVLDKPKQGEVNEKLFPVHPTNGTLSLKAIESHQFLPLSTQDNKKFRLVHDINEGSGWVEVWQGFIEPSTWKETYHIGIPNTVEIPVVDNVKILEKEPFTDDNKNLLGGDMKLIKVIAHILKKTGLSLKIRCGINIFEENHVQESDGSSDPLDQTYVDVTCYREGTDPFMCWDVLVAILRPFGARLVQANAQWLIEETDRAVATYAYRIFSADGDYESNSTKDPIIDIEDPIDIDRATIADREMAVEKVPAYGKISIISQLNYIGSVVAGGFEKEDLLSPDAEEFIMSQGIFKSEEGFKDWTLRMPSGVSGVSFGRVVVANRGDSSRLGLRDEKDKTRSVGAFYYNPDAWGGNIRDAYIESAEKPYQYGPGDELKLVFDYSTPARPEYEFMVLRVMVKVGSNYLQPGFSWGASEAIYRAYPSISNSLQQFELSLPVPDTDVVVDSTIQIRIYYYAAGFYDYGIPTATGDAGDGTDGLAALDDLVSNGIDYDYRFDLRRWNLLPIPQVAHEFFELRFSEDVVEDIQGGLILAGDYDSATNPRFYYRLKSVNVHSAEINADRRGVDLKFYIDNVAIDALINGQPPPEDETISLDISQFLNETLEVPLYNFDVPDITNAKNMYNNHFKLSDGTPTSAWARTGINERLKLQQILLKVLGANHSAPTYRITGPFRNEFSRIGVDNCLRITKPGANLAITNPAFGINLDDWTGDASGQAFAWSSASGGSAEVVLSGEEDSEKRYQAIDHDGGHIRITSIVHVEPSEGNTREDKLWLLYYRDGDIIHTEKIHTFNAVTSPDDVVIDHIAFLPKDIDAIGFYFKRVAGTGDCTYQIEEFNIDGYDLEEVYQISDYSWDGRNNVGDFELLQMSKTYISLIGVDQGGTNQSGSGTGNDFNGDFNEDFGGAFDTTLN